MMVVASAPMGVSPAASLPTVVMLLIVIATLAQVLPILYSLLFSPTKRVPGPFWARVTRWWEYRLVKNGQSNWEYIRLHEKYGKVVRMGPDRYSFSNPDDVKTIYEIGRSFPKSAYYQVGLSDDPEKWNIFAVRDEKIHKERRRKISSLYTMSTMVSYESAIDRMTRVCLRKLKEFADNERLISLPNFMQFYAFDVIGEITFNTSFDMMENEGDIHGMIEGIHRFNNHLGMIGLIPDLHPWLTRIGTIFGQKGPADTLIQYSVSQINKHREQNSASNNEKYNTFLKKLLDLESAHKVNMPNMLDAAGGNIAAGSDTTSIALSSLFYHLYTNSEILKKLRHEIDTMAADARLSDPVTYQEAQNMPYMQAIIKEALRIHPGVGTMLARSVPKGGITLNGTFFPEGTEVGVNAWVMHYDKVIFGEDAGLFKPERWLGPKEERSKWMDSMWMPFGMGSRTCLGKNISLLELTKAVPQIVRNFDFTIEKKSDIIPTHCTWFVYPKYKVWVQPRSYESS